MGLVKGTPGRTCALGTGLRRTEGVGRACGAEEPPTAALGSGGAEGGFQGQNQCVEMSLMWF